MKLFFVLTFVTLFTDISYSTVNDNEETKPQENEAENDETTNKPVNIYWLRDITHFARKENVIDISLDQKPYPEVCFIQPPNNSMVEASLFKMKGVTVQHKNGYVTCTITIGPLDDSLIGRWNLCGMSKHNSEMRCQPATISWYEDKPHNQDFIITVLERQRHLVQIGNNLTVEVSGETGITENCVYTSPAGSVINNTNVPLGVTLGTFETICQINFNPITEQTSGEWQIIGSFRNGTLLDEIRLTFDVVITENYKIDERRYVKEGQDIYLHLFDELKPFAPETCMLYGPNGTEYTKTEIDPKYNAITCGYILRNADRTHNGTWIIEYGYKIKRRGSIDIRVINREELNLDDIYWTIGESVNLTIGPTNAVYCRIWNYNQVLYDDFGKCKIVLDRVEMHHEGYWTVEVVFPGTVRLRNIYAFVVRLRNKVSDKKALITNTVERSNSSIMLTCSVPVQHEVHGCKFRGTRNEVLIAAQGVGQDGYMFNQSMFVNYESQVNRHNCTLRIINPSVYELGIWRCALDTSTGTYYGFLHVIFPELMQDLGSVHDVVTEPVLRSRSLQRMEGEPVTMECSTSSALRYCYFRACNGTVYNVFPTMPVEDNYEYIGAGLDAGECGIKFKRFSMEEAKNWTCHVGLFNATAGELSMNVYPDITAKMAVRHYWKDSSLVVVEARVFNEQPLDYCRFVRSDGIGFTSDNLPPGYTMDKSMYRGFCILYIKNPSIVDLQPWTIAAKATAYEGELSKTTIGKLVIVEQLQSNNSEVLPWLLMITVCLIPVIAAAALLSKRNRDWVCSKASRVKEIFKSSSNNGNVREESLLER